MRPMSNWLIGTITSTSYLIPEVSMNLRFSEIFAGKVVNKRLTFMWLAISSLNKNQDFLEQEVP